MTGRDELTAWLAGRDGPELERTLTLRPDALYGSPVRDLEDLANRLVGRESVARALQELASPMLQVLEVLAALGAGATIDRATELLDRTALGLDAESHHSYVEAMLRALGFAALAWPRPDGRYVVNPGLHDAIPYPLAIGRPVEVLLTDVPSSVLRSVVQRWGLPAPTRKAELVEEVRTFLADESRVRKLLSEAPESVARVLLDRSNEAARRAFAQVGGDPVDDVEDYYAAQFDRAAYAARQTAVAWARENGLGFNPNTFGMDVELPAETVLALKAAEIRAPFTPVSPTIATAPVTDGQVHSSAAGAITEFLAVAMATLETVTRTPMAALKAGGIGARELAKVAKRLGADVKDVRVTLELAVRLRLLEKNRAGNLTTSANFAEWRRGAPAQRAADLVATWFAMAFAPSNDRDYEDKSLPALALSAYGSGTARALRGLALRHVDRLDDGVGVTGVETLVQAIEWRIPLIATDPYALDLTATWVEAQRFGVVAHGRLSEVGVALLEGGPAELVDALTGMLPAVQRTALFGSDLTVVVPGSPDPAVVDLLDAMAVREGRGVASTWRVTPESVRGALDDGYDAAALAAGLRGFAESDLPQALEYLLQDVGKRHGHVKVGPAGAVVQSEDSGLLSEVEVNRGLRGLGLRRIAPTVLLAEAPVAQVVAGLRAAGYLPLELGAGGGRVVQLRSATVNGGVPNEALADVDDADDMLREWAAELAARVQGRRGPPVPDPEPASDAAARLVNSVLPPGAVPVSPLERRLRGSAQRLSADEVRCLAYAIEHGESVVLTHSVAGGAVIPEVLSRLKLGDGVLIGWSDAQRQRIVQLDRIDGVRDLH